MASISNFDAIDPIERVCVLVVGVFMEIELKKQFLGPKAQVFSFPIHSD
jgi:hypothetical protein